MSTTSENQATFMSKYRYWIVAVAAVVLLALLLRGFIGGASDQIPGAPVQQGEFVIDLKESGRLRAENSESISAPPIRVPLQIISLVPEGSVVEKGDTLIQFDPTELEQRLDEYRSELDLVKSNRRRDLASMRSQMASLKNSVENARASYRLSELRLEQMKFEADVRIEEGKLNLLQAELSLNQAIEKVRAQEQMDSADVRSMNLKIKQAELDIEKAIREIDKLTVIAPAPGLVVYEEIWKGGTRTKVKVGDTPWRGMALLKLPDLSVMLVETSVNEVDVAKVEVGKPVEITLDAYPDPTFHGEIIEVANMARSQDGVSEAKVFDVLVRIREKDQLLKPGMSATARIIVDRIPEETFIPIESVFYRGEQPVVYIKDGSSWKQNEVEIGKRNDSFVIVKAGLNPGQEVALSDPTADSEFEYVDTEKPQNGKSAAPNNN